MLFRGFRKRRAIAAYATRLPRLLLRDYGPAKTYSPAQVKRTIERAGLSTPFDCYAFSMFSNQAGFDAYHRETGEICAYEPMRQEIAVAYFHGNADFGLTDMFDAAAGSGIDVAGHHGGH